MRCPSCNSDDLTVKHTTNPLTRPLPQDFTGMNMIRRHRKCNQCRTTFFTVEIPEAQFVSLQHYMDNE